MPWEVGAFRRDEYAGLLTPSRWRRPCIAPPHFLRVARGCPLSLALVYSAAKCARQVSPKSVSSSRVLATSISYNEPRACGLSG